ncbi:MAG: anaerobic ribonucleoside-triphosphate reductase [Defluviitaleaceae bacterium]|nr:anaerobic ribonucleoside-triphosphate reductase [Defluviitaleaceae bacterium]MCL2274855.1 anaerobic ribonucleoside-triphosphate reductase [Defluviitaleaceae bacterium]
MIKLRHIVKRDNRKMPFDEHKITACIEKVFTAVNGEGNVDRLLPITLTLEVLKKLDAQYGAGEFTVENVQDLVEEVLIEGGYTKAAKSYILYRNKRTHIREARSELMDAVAEIVKETSRSNANVGHSPSAKVLQISEAASKNYYLNRVLPPEQAQAHLEGDMHIHDLSWYGKTLTCIQIPLGRMLKDGFSNGHGFIKSPKSIRTAAALAAIILQSNQNDMHGGQSFGFFDRDLSHFVEVEYARQERLLQSSLGDLKLTGAKDKDVSELIEKRTYEETYQAMEGFIYNLNTMHSRAGAQVPFSSVNLGTDTSRGGRMITECFLKAYASGLGRGETPMFPNVCFKVKDGINTEPEDPNYDLLQIAMHTACKRLMPTFSFQDATFNAMYDDEVGYMGCRTRVIANINGPQVTDGRGNLSFSTINLPRLGIRAKQDMPDFWKRLDEILDFTIKQLLTRYDVQKNLKVRDFPFLMGQKLYVDSEKLGMDDKIEPAAKHGTLSVGFIGLAECLVALTGKHHGENPGSQALGISIISHMRRRCDEASQKHSMNITLLATPAEELAGRLLRSDFEKFGAIAGVTDKKWYTNSFHVPVEYKITALEKIATEGPYHKYCNAGHISYVELVSAPDTNIEVFEDLIRAMGEADMGYAAINFPVDICKECGQNGLINENNCTRCSSDNISRVRRITGYLSTLDRFNDSKKAEESNREKHEV